MPLTVYDLIEKLLAAIGEGYIDAPVVSDAISAETDIKNLRFVGADCATHGVEFHIIDVTRPSNQEVLKQLEGDAVLTLEDLLQMDPDTFWRKSGRIG